MDQVPQPLDARRVQVALMKRKESPTVTPAYLAAWAKLFARSPAEIEAERQARQPAPAPQPPGSRKGPISPPESTQTAEVLPVPHLPKKAKP